MKTVHNKTAIALLVALGVTALPATADDGARVGLLPTDEDSTNVTRGRPYSPYAGRGFPTQVYWGDTHVHTDNSLDAKGFGANIDVEVGLRFARGEEVVSSTGQAFKLSRPLDWVVISDHSDGMGAMKEIIKGNPRLLAGFDGARLA